MRLFDSHAHLNDQRFDQDREALILELQAKGVEGVIECATDAKDMEKAVALAQQYERIYAVVGVHPHSCNEYTEQVEEKLRSWILAGQAVAIGEIGLDYHYDFCPRDMQRQALEQQLLLAKDLGAPVILHCREATADMLRILAEADYYRGVMHCFSGSVETGEFLLNKGMYLGFGGSLTFKNNVKTVKMAEAAPLDKILIETDCPYLAPVPMRGKRNEPAYTEYVANKLAEIKGIRPEEIAEQALQNARELFGIR